MNRARHRSAALSDLDELVGVKARHAHVHLLAHGTSRRRFLLTSVRHVLRQSCARTKLRAALRLVVLCNLYSLAHLWPLTVSCTCAGAKLYDMSVFICIYELQ